MNLAFNLERITRFFPQHPAIITDDVQLTYEALNHRAGRIASGIKALGVRPGDLVGLCAPNSPDWIAFYFGVLKSGAVAVTLSAQLSEDEFRFLAGHSRPSILYTVSERLNQLASLDAPKPKTIARGGDLDLAELVRLGPEPMAALDRARDDTACVLYTGGTTGTPKGVMLTHENINTSLHNVVHTEQSNEKDRALCFLPFNHVFGQIHIMNATILSGGGLVLLPGFDMDRTLSAIQDHSVTKLYGVPTIYSRLIQLDRLKRRLHNVRYCFSAAASMARDLVLQWKKTTGIDISESYGMTETATMVTYNHCLRHVVGSVGTPVGTTEVSIQDKQGNRLPTGREGEICVRGRNVMKGYLNNPEETAKAFRGKWLRTGDIGYLDDREYLFIVDRLKDMIITGGENVYSREVEEVLYERGEVTECAVIGLPDQEYGERVTAYLVLKPGEVLDTTELKTFCKSRLSPFKVPKAFFQIDSLPTSPAGKILKKELRKNVRYQSTMSV